jgi:hypothetical protein
MWIVICGCIIGIYVLVRVSVRQNKEESRFGGTGFLRTKEYGIRWLPDKLYFIKGYLINLKHGDSNCYMLSIVRKRLIPMRRDKKNLRKE